MAYSIYVIPTVVKIVLEVLHLGKIKSSPGRQMAGHQNIS